MTVPVGEGEVVEFGDERWTLGEKLGEGGGGAVFAARSERDVDGAVKFVAKTGAEPRDNLIQRPEAELRNIMPIWAAGEQGQWWTFVMPRGETSLEGYLLRRPVPIDQAGALAILTDIANALEDLDLHDGVVHRDIKPANVVRYQGSWQLVDFGIARLVEAATAALTKRAAFSPPYTAPERWRDRRAECPADVYSWGVIAYELLAGRLPFLGPLPEDFREQHLHTLAPDLLDVAEPLAVVVEECLSKSPSSRPTATELLRTLQRRDVRLSPQRERLRAANRDVVRQRTRRERAAERHESAQEDDDARYDDALAGFRRLSQKLRQDLISAASAAEDRSFRLGWRLRLGGAALSLGVPSPAVALTGDRPRLPFKVIAQARLALEWPGSRPNGMSYALWYCDSGSEERFDWYESAYRWRGDRTSAELPFALSPADAAEAYAPTPGRFVVDVRPTRLDYAAQAAFVDRWADRLAWASRKEGEDRV